MDIAILGGTGDFGGGLTLRLARDTEHDLVVGSRDPERAAAAVAEYREQVAAHGVDASIVGRGNAAAVAGSDVVVLAVPHAGLEQTVVEIADDLADDATLVSPAVALRASEDGLQYDRPAAGSTTAVAAAAAPDGVPVVGAFHSLAAGRLADLDRRLDVDTLVVGDDPDARATVGALAEEIDGLRALDAGPLANAASVEALAPLLITVGENEGLDDPGIRLQ